MLFLLLRIMCAPLAVLLGTLAQRRFGHAIGGLVVGLPLVYLPFLWLISLQYGLSFAHAMTVSLLLAASAEVALLWSFAALARRVSSAPALGGALGAFALIATAVQALHVSIVLGAVLAIASFTIALRWWPRTPVATFHNGKSRLSLRLAVSTIFTVALISLAGRLGASLSGVLDAIPLTSLMMALFTNHEHGAAASSQFLSGVTRGSYSYVASMIVLAEMLRTGHVLEAFGASLGIALLVQLAIQSWSSFPSLRQRISTLSRPPRLMQAHYRRMYDFLS